MFEHEEVLTRKEIKRIIPHRWPFLLLDTAQYSSAMSNIIITTKKISRWDLFLWGHFPNKKIYPAVLLVEIVAQSAAVLCKKKFPDLDGLPFLGGFNEVRCPRPALPGDTLLIRTEFLSGGRPSRPFIFHGSITNQNGEIVCKVGELMGFLAKE